MSIVHVVRRGDTLSRIAREHGLRTWREIYYHPDNIFFRRRRPNPFFIHSGDEINIPDDRRVTVTTPTSLARQFPFLGECLQSLLPRYPYLMQRTLSRPRLISCLSRLDIPYKQDLLLWYGLDTSLNIPLEGFLNDIRHVGETSFNLLGDLKITFNPIESIIFIGRNIKDSYEAGQSIGIPLNPTSAFTSAFFVGVHFDFDFQPQRSLPLEE